jgi:hypothetical protein
MHLAVCASQEQFFVQHDISIEDLLIVAFTTAYGGTGNQSDHPRRNRHFVNPPSIYKTYTVKKTSIPQYVTYQHQRS